jgi:hypothetical protein
MEGVSKKMNRHGEPRRGVAIQGTVPLDGHVASLLAMTVKQRDAPLPGRSSGSFPSRFPESRTSWIKDSNAVGSALLSFRQGPGAIVRRAK